MGTTTILEASAIMTALLCVVLAVWQYRASWILAILSSGLYIPIFWAAELYWDAILQLFFIATAAYGYVEWGHTRAELPVSRRSLRFHVAVLSGCMFVVGCILWVTSPTSLVVGLLDASMFAFSIAASLIIGRKIFDGWIYWLVIDTVATALYLYKGLWGTAGLYLVYVGLVIVALSKWRKSMRDDGALPSGFKASPTVI